MGNAGLAWANGGVGAASNLAPEAWRPLLLSGAQAG